MSVTRLSAIGLLVGCTHHRPLASTNEITDQTWVKVKTTNLGEVDALAIPTGTQVVYQLESGAYLDLGNVVRVTEDRTLRGAGEGFLIGAGVGIVTGAAIGFADGDDPPCGDGHEWCILNMTATDKAILGGILLGGLGGLLGVAVGVVRGSTYIYEDGRGVAITPTGPSGSVAGLTISY